MSRRNQGGVRGGGGGRNISSGAGAGAGDAALLAADRVLSAESEYRKAIKQMQATALLLADKIAHGGDVEVALLGGDKPGNDEGDDQDNKTVAFLREQRDRLKALCEGNVRRDADVDTFVAAVRDVRDELLSRQQRDRAASRAQDEQGGEDTPPPEEEDVDYEASIRDRIDAAKRSKAATALDPRDEQFCRDVRKRLNEKEPKKKKKGRGGGDDEDDDDDLEVMANTNTNNQEGDLKCPMTGMLFEDPVRNKVCGHTYSRAGVMQMFRNQKHNCPIPGCVNDRMTESQLEEDMEMVMRVQRHQRRVRQEEERRARDRAMEQEDDDEEEEFDEGENGGYTVVE